MATGTAPFKTSTMADVDEADRLERLDHMSENEIRDMAKILGINPGRSKKITLINKIIKAEDAIQAAKRQDDEAADSIVNTSKTIKYDAHKFVCRLASIYNRSNPWSKFRLNLKTNLRIYVSRFRR